MSVKRQSAGKLLATLPAPYAQEAISNTSDERLRWIHDDWETALYASFNWAESPQGKDYWRKFINKYKVTQYLSRYGLPAPIEFNTLWDDNRPPDDCGLIFHADWATYNDIQDKLNMLDYIDDMFCAMYKRKAGEKHWRNMGTVFEPFTSEGVTKHIGDNSSVYNIELLAQELDELADDDDSHDSLYCRRRVKHLAGVAKHLQEYDDVVYLERNFFAGFKDNHTSNASTEFEHDVWTYRIVLEVTFVS